MERLDEFESSSSPLLVGAVLTLLLALATGSRLGPFGLRFGGRVSRERGRLNGGLEGVPMVASLSLWKLGRRLNGPMGRAGSGLGFHSHLTRGSRLVTPLRACASFYLRSPGAGLDQLLSGLLGLLILLGVLTLDRLRVGLVFDTTCNLCHTCNLACTETTAARAPDLRAVPTASLYRDEEQGRVLVQEWARGRGGDVERLLRLADL